MTKEIILKELEALFLINANQPLVKLDSDIMGHPLLLSACEAASFFLNVERKFAINLNELLPSLTAYSIDSISDKIVEFHCKNSKREIKRYINKNHK